MHIELITVGMFQSNCFVIDCEDTGEAIIIDAGDEGARILEYVNRRNLKVRAIVNTHAHIDHVAALPEVVSSLSAPVYMHRDEVVIYENLKQQADYFGLAAPEGVKIERFLEHGDKIEFGNWRGDVFHTPGHSPGGISIVFEKAEPSAVFVGDVLFRGSIGRTDLFGSDHTQMIDTLRDFILPLPDDMVVYPGHGQTTTIGLEKRTNPFLLQIAG
jgi:glyoxylase-like metal-dependent hydrolase (beta-lactamase superfamily II)